MCVCVYCLCVCVYAAQVRWVFEVHDGTGWAEVGAGPYRLLSSQGLGVYRGSAALYPGIPYPTPEARSRRVDIGLHSPFRPPSHLFPPANAPSAHPPTRRPPTPPLRIRLRPFS